MRVIITLTGIKSMLKKVFIVVFYSKVISKTTNLSYMYDIIERENSLLAVIKYSQEK